METLVQFLQKYLHEGLHTLSASMWRGRFSWCTGCLLVLVPQLGYHHCYELTQKPPPHAHMTKTVQTQAHTHTLFSFHFHNNLIWQVESSFLTTNISPPKDIFKFSKWEAAGCSHTDSLLLCDIPPFIQVGLFPYSGSCSFSRGNSHFCPVHSQGQSLELQVDIFKDVLTLQLSNKALRGRCMGSSSPRTSDWLAKIPTSWELQLTRNSRFLPASQSNS